MNYTEKSFWRGRVRRISWITLLLVCLWTTPLTWAVTMAWGEGRVYVTLTPNDPFTNIVFSDDPSSSYIHALGCAYHNHAQKRYDSHMELLGYTEPIAQDELGHPPEVLDGVVSAYNIYSFCPISYGQANVRNVTVATHLKGGPYIDITDKGGLDDVYCVAESSPAGVSDAEGFGRHDDVFWIESTAPELPPFGAVKVSMKGQYKIGGSCPDLEEEWWSSMMTYVEVYDLVTGTVLDRKTLSDKVHGGPYDEHSSPFELEFNVNLVPGACYSLNFALDIESHAQSIPEPSTLFLLGLGGVILRRSR